MKAEAEVATLACVMSTSGSLSICLDPPDVRLVVLGHRKVGKTGKHVALLQ